MNNNNTKPVVPHVETMGEKWGTRIKVLFFSGLFASIGNWVATNKTAKPLLPWEVWAPIGVMIALVCVGIAIDDFIRAKTKVNLPAILYISAMAIIISIPGVPGQPWIITNFAKIGLLPLCTPILAYAGISIGKDLDEFKKQGFAIICVAICTFFGTYIGSALIAQVVLKMTGAI